ncbi:MAG: hypothetical protein E7292_08460 [Lachnospiraceae bacterium]|nr:hypothetical protein [Lachnospiraceae bacterium]
MYECPNCAANLKFDIKAQMLFCDHCETLMDPQSVVKEQDAEVSPYFETTVYLCPQCGGQILCDDQTMATFCCYCGSSTVLTSRIRQQKRPKYIIPFQKTKENCRESYREMVKGAFWAPKEFKDANALDRFRAIYMPYWLCKAEADEDIEFTGVNITQRGDYRCTHTTEYASHVKSSIEGMMYDASSAFPDQLSSQIEPFFLSDRKPFTESYLSGFYADSNDVDARDYNQICQNLAVDYCAQEFRSQFPRHSIGNIGEGISLTDALDVHEVKQDLAMFPVWFLSYRKKDKVAYGVMNGQTGKVALELPIDVKKFIGVSLLVSLPIIFLLNLFFVIKPNFLLGIMIVLASVLGFLIQERNSLVLEKMFYEDFQMVMKDREAEIQEEKKRRDFWGRNLFPTLYFGFLALLGIRSSIDLTAWIRPSYILIAVEVAFLYFLYKRIKKAYRLKDVSFYHEETYKAEWNKMLRYFIKPIAIIVMAMVVLFINPVSDIIYYSAVVIGMGIMLWTMLDLINIQNKLLMRPLPQFNTRGGDEDAYKML